MAEPKSRTPVLDQYRARRRASKDRWQELYRQREKATKEEQAVLGPREHGAWAEFRVIDNPVYGPIEQLFAIPGYTAAKAVGLLGGRSPASVDELAEAYKGMGRGLISNLELLRMLGYQEEDYYP